MADSKADRAYRAAVKEIERVRKAGGTTLDLSGTRFRALTRIPPEIAGVQGLSEIDLSRTAVADLAPLASLTALRSLWLNQTAVADLAPLAGLTALQTLRLDQTAVADLAPLAGLTALQWLKLDQTAVADLSPLAGLTALQWLWLSQTAVADLAPLAGLTALESLALDQTAVADVAPLAGLTALQTLRLDQTAVADLAPLAGLTALRSLFLSQTAVADLAPLSGLTALADLALDGTPITDLRPIKGADRLGTDDPPGLTFSATAATAQDAELDRLSRIEDTADRARETLAYLASLPPWPQPYTPRARPDGQPPQPIGDAKPPEPPPTLEALMQAQDLAGWRFSPAQGVLSLYIRDVPADQRQEQLARMAADRCAKLLAKLGTRTNSGGFRQEVHEEAVAFAAILAETGRSLAERSLELWGSLIALGELLDANDRGRREGRDALDLLPEEARAALGTFLASAATLVRSFPEARALDDDHGGFARRGATRQLVMDLLQDAVRAALVSEKSALLIGQVAEVAEGQGKQADKASTVSVKGLRNLVMVSTLIGSTIGGVAGGVLEDIGGDISDHYELAEKAIEFLDGTGDKLDELLDALPPDEAAHLRAKVEDHRQGRKGPR
ncbi:hypothetical protein LHP98_03455 [Rhodobacter sp. Har01]|uniref:leucine-rich repeat domain-containing protein n=1 Tax=Rhodobacter sp. Har01 TaxID=2883999 RepID=UPI001D091E01|nr:leucine-rich repeat domain-containing protein [Rhodobacter sp. Har01]MCB6177185.1 hypothetical protein [Rhodobacter sp. Har01]